ncbi:MAG UNVERIFIED_CONTAM: hypothetical protein LVR18_49165 [Planctomycetaceae bacterium]|jgi:hypothetical protein
MMVLLISGLIFLLSGAAGLADEILWFRMLTTVFGRIRSSAGRDHWPFMAGLALGSALAARMHLQPRRAAYTYAIFECLIAAAALLMPLALKLVSGLPDLAGSAVEQPELRAVVRFATVLCCCCCQRV